MTKHPTRVPSCVLFCVLPRQKFRAHVIVLLVGSTFFVLQRRRFFLASYTIRRGAAILYGLRVNGEMNEMHGFNRLESKEWNYIIKRDYKG